MPQAPPDLSHRLVLPWWALVLLVFGGVLLGREGEALSRVAGCGAALAGAWALARAFRRQRDLFARLLAAIPLEDKSEALFRKLPKAWAALEQENLRLSTHLELEDQIRRQILTHLRAGVVLLGQDRKVWLFNPAAQTILGLSSHLEAGESLAAAFREPESLRCLEAAFAGSGAEWTLKRPPRTLFLRAIPFQVPGEAEAAPPWVLVTLDDLTRQEALETTRQKFISNAGHELKTPVTALRVALENLQDGAMVLPQGEASLRSMLRSMDRMTLLLADISELSRIESGALRLEPVPLHLGDFLEDLLDAQREPARARQVGIRLDCPQALTARVLQADPLRLAQLLENLLANAIKFSPAGAEVTVGLRQEGPWLAWTVTDQGPGISPTDAQRIFERFYRAPSARAVPGTGLGLAIVKHLALLMEGEVAVASEPGHGSTFTFRLPAAEIET